MMWRSSAPAKRITTFFDPLLCSGKDEKGPPESAIHHQKRRNRTMDHTLQNYIDKLNALNFKEM